MSLPSSLAAIAACAALLAAPSAGAADLAAGSRIGAIFAEPPERIVLPPHYAGYEANNIASQTIFALQRRIPGYYGGAWDFYYQPYYGTSPVTIFERDPYFCTTFGRC